MQDLKLQGFQVREFCIFLCVCFVVAEESRLQVYWNRKNSRNLGRCMVIRSCIEMQNLGRATEGHAIVDHPSCPGYGHTQV